MDEPLMPDPIILVDPAYERGYAEGLETGMAQAREEIERLREALRKIAEWDLTGTAIAALGEKE